MTTDAARSARIRALAGGTSAVGALLVLQPRRAAKWAARSGTLPHPTVIRVLGGRQLAQGAVQFGRPRTDAVVGGLAVDLLHLLSMLAVATFWRTYRRPALVSAAVAGATAGAGIGILLADG